MTLIRFFYPENPLAKLIEEPGGMAVTHAVARAESNLVTARTDYVADVDRNLARLQTLLPPSAHPPSPDAAVEAYQRANEVAGIAGVCGLDSVGKACFSLCELLDLMNASGRWNGEAVAVHMAALKLLRGMKAKTGEGAVLKGLRQLVAHEIAVDAKQ
ncbi:MAG: hypothetical protein ABI655_06905 [Phenylobacterium sp.]